MRLEEFTFSSLSKSWLQIFLLLVFRLLQRPDSASQILYSSFDIIIIELVLQKGEMIIQGFWITREHKWDKILIFAAVCSVKMFPKLEILSVFKDVYAPLTHGVFLCHSLLGIIHGYLLCHIF